MKLIKDFVSRKDKRTFLKSVTAWVDGEKVDTDVIMDAQDVLMSSMTGKTIDELQEVNTKEYEETFEKIKKMMDTQPWEWSTTKDKK